jgi:glycosyltransferase involved in cell wall biosynthesis
MRILQVIAYIDRGGAERVALQLAAGLVGARHVAAIAAGHGAWEGRVAAAGAQYFPLPDHAPSAPAFVAETRALRRVIAAFRPDIVHAHNVTVTMSTTLAAATLRPRRPVVTTFHGVPPERYRLAARLLALAGGRVAACSQTVGDQLVAAGLPGRRVEVIPNGTTLPGVAPETAAALRSELRTPGRRLVVGVGRAVEQKAWSVLLDVAESVPDTDFVVVGDGPLLPALSQEASARRVPVRFLGGRDDVPAILEIADCFVSTSVWEGLPVSLLEALHAGRPGVATGVDGVPDIVGPSFVLVPPHDPHRVAEALCAVLGDIDRYRALAGATAASLRAQGSEQMVAAYARLYNGALAAARPKRSGR